MTQRCILIAAAGTAILLIAVIAATGLFPGRPLSREEMCLVHGFATAYTVCIDSAGTRQDTYEDVYRCRTPR